MDESDESTTRRARELIAWLEQGASTRCASCASELCAHERLFASALGYRRQPLCSACAAREGGVARVDELRGHLRAHFEHRDCYRAAWSWADAREPRCELGRVTALASPNAAAANALELTHETWDAGELGCGELVLELRMRLRAMEAGELLELFARDAGANEDLPAWCRMTGHELVHARAPRFVIRRRREGSS